jgi:Tfp pilus assembly protein PilF
MGRRSLVILLAISVEISLLSSAGLAQNSMIRGKVRGHNGTTINNAIVELRGPTGGIIGETVTRTDGDFAFTNLRPGEYQVLVSMSGYVPHSEVVQLRSGSMVNPTQNRDVISEVASIDITLRAPARTPVARPGTTFVQDIPPAARTAYAQGMEKIRDGKSDEGVALLRQAVDGFNDYFDAHFALGCEYYRLGKDTEAIEEFERARLINDRGAVVYYMFGLVMVRQQKFRAAEYAFRQAAELDDSMVAAHFNHGVALIELALRSKAPENVKTFLSEAEKELERAWSLSNKRLHTVLLQRARIHEQRGDREAAARELESYLAAVPDSKDTALIKERITRLREKK